RPSQEEVEIIAKVSSLQQNLQALTENRLTPLDFLPKASLAERVISLVLGDAPPCSSASLTATFNELTRQIGSVECDDLKVVVFGGGTGLSNIIGGDSRRVSWRDAPFTGLKEIFSHVHSVVCITDDGGSTGELLKDLPLVALGDLRHVMLSSVRRETLKKLYGLDEASALETAGTLHTLFNYRFISPPASADKMIYDSGVQLDHLPDILRAYLQELIWRVFGDSRLQTTLNRPQCLGNLLLASAIYKQLDPNLDSTEMVAAYQTVRTATIRGLIEVSTTIGAHARSVLPCTTTVSQLQILYGNGVLVTSEDKSGNAQRGYPVDRVFVEYCRNPFLPPEVVQLIQDADILIFAPGSLYTSIIPILQVPGLADAVRKNTSALKLLVANIWVQKGETDVARDEPNRKFHVSDLILAYHRNILEGVEGLFSHILTLNLGDIPGSVLQRYALEDKEPIYLDRSRVRELGFEVVEACIFSKELLQQRLVIQHDPDMLARAIHTLWGLKVNGFFEHPYDGSALPQPWALPPVIRNGNLVPCLRYDSICTALRYVSTEQLSVGTSADKKMTARDRKWLLDRIIEVIWCHPDILPEHLRFIQGITLVESSNWKRCQQWDNVFSFYDPQDGRIKIRQDQTEELRRFEIAFLVALGQSLLGNYAQDKQMQDVRDRGEIVGRMYCLTIREEQHLRSFFSLEEIGNYLRLARMQPSAKTNRLYTRIVNGGEGFTPPGLLFGLFYAWYLDNRFAANIEYKMSIIKDEVTDLIPEQMRLVDRRKNLITFFREKVFKHQLPEPALPEL
ncbi:MAG: YvcK family protein, partial [Desulfobulbaceae bacterium]|nr:YvcK family protein [Desulfobulbaceae bacterium]